MRIGTDSTDTRFVVVRQSYEMGGTFCFYGESMSPPNRVGISSPDGIGPIIWVTREEYDSIAETASILSDKQMMDAIASSERDIDTGNVKSWDQLKEEMGL
jgi:hypothetical protein